MDTKVGNGHVVMFGIRPFWRWQTQGTFFLGFNTILNWNDLDAGKAEPPKPAAGDAGQSALGRWLTSRFAGPGPAPPGAGPVRCAVWSARGVNGISCEVRWNPEADPCG